MRKFLLKSSLFLLLVFLLAYLSTVLPTPNEKTNMLFALQDKHAQLKKIKSPKILLVGGSNICFGVDTKRMIDSLDIPIFDLGLHAGLGQKYIMDDARPYINKGDLVVLLPEYGQFDEDAYYGSDEVIQVLFDVVPEAKKSVDFEQISYLFEKMPTYIGNKYFNLFSQLFSSENEITIGIYDRRAFNEFGDNIAHLNLKNESFTPDMLNGLPDKTPFKGIKDFKKYVESQNAALLVSFPSYSHNSYVNSKTYISEIHSELGKITKVISTPERYVFADSLFFNSFYHLNKDGRKIRTDYLVEDLKHYIRDIK